MRRNSRLKPAYDGCRRWRCVVIMLVAVTALAAPGVAHAFDTSTHYDITGDAFAAEGFRTEAVRTAQANNWFNDLYVNPDKIPQSGHASWWKWLLGSRWYVGETEDWSDAVIQGATRMHFDSTDGGKGYRRAADLEQEWRRLLDMTVRVCREGRTGDPLTCVTALGISTHAVQDFYAHTNWVESRFTFTPGFDGPGWHAAGQGSAPTWFDLQPAIRDPRVSRVTTNGTPSDTVDTRDGLFNRGHGGWRSDGNTSLATKMNKDWPGRPLYSQAYMAAYFATRQWVQAVEQAIGDPAYWASVEAYVPARLNDRIALETDIRDGARGLSFWTGHWQGQGEPLGGDSGPGGSLDDAFAAARTYFSRDASTFRKRYEQLVPRLRESPAPLLTYNVRSTRSMQQSTRFVRVQILRLKSRGAGDLGPDDADFYAESLIDGRHFLSGFIHGYDTFNFGRPNAPFTFIRAVTVAATRPRVLNDLTVEIRTGRASGAGTDDNIYLRLNNQVRYQLDRSGVDDFERGSVATYSLPIDARFPFNATSTVRLLRDIAQIQIEKSRDGSSGAWLFDTITVRANGVVLYTKQGINTWLRGSSLTWRAPDFTRPAPESPLIPVWLKLYDADSFLYGGDDHADIHPFARRKNIGVEYELGTVVDRVTRGGDVFGNPLAPGGDRAEMRYRIDTLVPEAPPEPPPPPPPPPPPTQRPDLIVTELTATTVTLKNVGAGAAGTFRVTVGTKSAFDVPGLAPGAQVTVQYSTGCGEGTRTATVDSLNQVAETNEGNNTLTLDFIC